MTVNLSKGQTVSLAKNGGIRNVMVGLGWSPASQESEITQERKKGFFGKLFGGSGEHSIRNVIQNIDCDAFAIITGDNGYRSEVVYFGNLNSRTNAVKHSGDNLTGEGDGDDEVIYVNLDKLDSAANRVILAVNIYNAKSKNQDFSKIKDAYIRMVDMDKDTEVCIYKLSGNEYAGYVTMVLGELLLINGEWQFKACGEPSKANSINEFYHIYL